MGTEAGRGGEGAQAAMVSELAREMVLGGGGAEGKEGFLGARREVQVVSDEGVYVGEDSGAVDV